MGLKERMAQGVSAVVEAPGFCFDQPPVRRFAEIAAFQSAIKSQSDCTATVDVDTKSFVGIDIDGKVHNSSWRLSPAAFGDLCHWTKLPVAFIKRLAKTDEQLALEVVESCIDHWFHSGPPKQFVIDTTTGRVDGIVGKESYAPIANKDVVDFVFSATPDLKICEGWLAGPNMRLTAVLGTKPAEPRKGDIVHIGTAVENSINGDCSLKVCDYANRLVCTNGMTAREGFHMERIVHRGDIEANTIKAIIRSATRSEQMVPLMAKAAAHLVNEKEVRAIKGFLSEQANGGSEAFFKKVAEKAMDEAKTEGRDPDEVTLWNIVNGITESAHDTSSLNRRVEIEALGYRTLVKFGAVLNA